MGALPGAEAACGSLNVQERDAGRPVGEVLSVFLGDERPRTGVGKLGGNGVSKGECWVVSHDGLPLVRAAQARAVARAR